MSYMPPEPGDREFRKWRRIWYKRTKRAQVIAVEHDLAKTSSVPCAEFVWWAIQERERWKSRGIKGSPSRKALAYRKVLRIDDWLLWAIAKHDSVHGFGAPWPLAKYGRVMCQTKGVQSKQARM